MEAKLKKGDLLTVATEAIANDYGRTRDFDAVKVDIKETLDLSDLRELSKKSIYKVVRGDIHEDLSKHKVNIHQYSVESERIQTIAFVEDGVKVNGEHDVPFDGNGPRNLSEAQFLDETTAVAVATMLNKQELKYLEELEETVKKAVVMFGQIVDKQMV